MGVAAQSNRVRPSRVDPNKPHTVRKFIENFYALESEDEAKPVWKQLTDAQEAAVVEALQESMYVETESNLNVGSTGDVTTEAIPVSYDEVVYGRSDVAGRLYKFEHSISWEIESSNNNVYNYSASSTGNAGALCWTYLGLDSFSLNQASSYFDSFRQGEVKHDCAGSFYYPSITLRGNGDGSGETLSKDSDI